MKNELKFEETADKEESLDVKELKELIENLKSMQLGISPELIRALRNSIQLPTSIVENFQEIAKALEQKFALIEEQYPQKIEIMTKVSELNWLTGINLEIDELFQLENSTNAEVDDYFIHYFSKNDFEIMFEELEVMIDFCDKGYRDQLITIKKLLKNDISNFKVLISTLFSIFEYRYLNLSGLLGTGSILTPSIEDKHQKLMKKIQDTSKIVDYDLIEIFVSKIIYKFLESWNEGQKFEDGVEKTNFTRPSVQHGMFNPSRFELKHLFQLISTMYLMECTLKSRIEEFKLNNKK